MLLAQRKEALSGKLAAWGLTVLLLAENLLLMAY